MPKKHKSVNKNVVHDSNKVSGWDDLIRLAQKNFTEAKVRQEELAAVIQVFAAKRDAGIPFPDNGQIERQLLE